MEQQQNTLPIGSVLRSGRREYKVESVLGKGGFGITYKVSAMERVGQIPVRVEFAMKEFFMDGCLRDASGTVSTAASKAEAADGLKDFVSEARRLNALCGKCRNIVPVDEVFETNGTAYYVMEFLDGGSLADYVRKHSPLSVGAAKTILRPVAEAVAFLHDNRITHLDIKPGNIMFRSDGEPVLIDFGLAKHYDRSGDATTTVRTLAYSAGFSPAEQYVGLKQFSPQSDVYALAATFSYVLTGKTPPEAIDLEYGLEKWSVCLPEEVRNAVVHAMAYSRKDRTLSVRDFIKELYGSELRAIGKSVPQPVAEPTAESETEVIGVVKSRQPHKKLWIIATFVAVAAVFGIVCAKFLSGEGHTEKVIEPASQLISVNGSQIYDVNGVKFTMLPVEGGTFTMGATSEHDFDVSDDEKPVHQVTLSDYYIGQTEVTQALWKAIMGSNPSYFKDDNHPVENVSWSDCQKFIKTLNQLTGKQFRLPTEAEWEYAARGGKKSQGYKYSGGIGIDAVAWYDGNSGNKTHPVATKQPNELGIYDMSGNVWEWCSDWYGSYSSSSQTNPQGVSSGSYRVRRGGSCVNNPRYCRVSCRSNRNPGCCGNYLGFRLVCGEPKKQRNLVLNTNTEKQKKNVKKEQDEKTKIYKQLDETRKRLDKIKKWASDSVKNSAPKFGLG